MKKAVFTATILSALVACSVPMTSHASELQLLKSGDGYAVFVGQGTEDLSEFINNICKDPGSSIICPELPALPPQACTPAQPDVQEPAAPVQPDSQEPDTPTQPDNQEPDTPTQPDNQEPDTSTQPDSQEPDTAETPDEVHSYVLQVLDLVNAERVKAGLSELKLDADVTAAANVRAREIQQSFSHTRPNGSSFSSALTEQGISYRRSGENIAWGQKSPEQVMNGWMNSAGHRANILNANFENIGIGYYQDANGTNYWVQLFTA